MTATITCPQWCDSDIGHARQEKENSLHYKHFGDTEGANIAVWVTYYTDGLIENSGVIFDIDESEGPEDMEEVAGWCTSAAAFLREIRAS